MKRLASLLLIITVVLLFLFSGWFSVETRANEGYWKLDGVTIDKNEDTERTTMTVEQGYATEGTIHQQSVTREVSAEFRAGYRDGDRLCLYVSASHTGHVAYCYVWIDQSSETCETTPPSQTADNEDSKKVWVSGIVTDVEFRVMPHMKVTINFYNDAAAHTSGGPPTHQIITHTDLEGRFLWLK